MWEDNLEPAPLLIPEKILTKNVISLDPISFSFIKRVLNLIQFNCTVFKRKYTTMSFAVFISRKGGNSFQVLFFTSEIRLNISSS